MSTRSRRRRQQPFQFVATCGAGLEKLVSGELLALGADQVVTRPGAVSWLSRSLETGYRACLWSRCASRILLELATFEAPDPDALYTEAGRIDWDDHFGPKQSLAVFCTLRNSLIEHNYYAALRVKDAIVDQFRTRTGKRPMVNTERPDIRINLHIDSSRATLALDLSGDSLHRRGYRRAGGPAPLKETLAAAVVQLSGWPERLSSDYTLVDPMCGAATLLIEAALMMTDSAPGLQRKRFGFMGWSRHNPVLWQRLVTEALARETAGMEGRHPRLIGFDADPRAVAAARANIQAAGLEEFITVRHQELANLQALTPTGMILTNPPYGERLLEQEIAGALYRGLGNILRAKFQGWQVGLLARKIELAEGSALAITGRKRLYNGPLKCWLLTGSSLPARKIFIPGKKCRPLAADHPGISFGNRLRKNLTRFRPWAQKNQVSCFRIYDADIPEFNLAVDLYEQWVHVQEYAPPAAVPLEKARSRFRLALAVIRECLDIPRERVFIKQRKKQSGRQQYQHQGRRNHLYEVHENGLSFLVNFTDYLDTGLFLDHRTIRIHIEKLALDRRFLNLFAYTGSATVYAARGGATSTTSVDISSGYLARAQANLAVNGYGGPRHCFETVDVLHWLTENKKKYDLILVDPPTFSNSRHRKQTFTVQKDHGRLLNLAMGRLSAGGILIFSTNFRKFRLDETLKKRYRVREITKTTIPPDFQRNPAIHRCWEFRHRQHQGRSIHG